MIFSAGKSRRWKEGQEGGGKAKPRWVSLIITYPAVTKFTQWMFQIKTAN